MKIKTEQRGNYEFSMEYALIIPIDEDVNEYRCPFCNNELLYVSCPTCCLSEKDKDDIKLNTACDECDDVERWKRCEKCNTNFNKFEFREGDKLKK